MTKEEIISELSEINNNISLLNSERRACISSKNTITVNVYTNKEKSEAMSLLNKWSDETKKREKKELEEEKKKLEAALKKEL